MSTFFNIFRRAHAALCALTLTLTVHAEPASPPPAPPPDTSAGTPAGAHTIDDFSDISKWKVVASDGVEGSISLEEGTGSPESTDGKSLRLDFDFKKGSGYCIVRREIDLPLPDNYRIAYWLMGTGIVNDLEFKLVDTTGENVWWNKQFNHPYPQGWERQRLARSQIEFAWGPGGGREPLRRAGAIEIAVTAGKGGKGRILLDDLTIEPLPPRSTEPRPVDVRIGATTIATIPPGRTASGPIHIPAGAGDINLTLDFGAPREFGGVMLEWDGTSQPSASITLTGTLSPGTPVDEPWFPARTVVTGEPTLIAGNGSDASHATITLVLEKDRPLHLKCLSLLPIDASRTPNALRRVIASVSPRGWYPRAFSQEMISWAVVGAPDDEFEALLGNDGQVEVIKSGPSIEPFIRTGGRLLTWADFTARSSLHAGHAPMPVVDLASDAGLSLRVEPFVSRPRATAPHAAVRYTLTNTSDRNATGTLILALRPFQVSPPWQFLGVIGGVSTVGITGINPALSIPDRVRVGTVEMIASRPSDLSTLGTARTHDIIADLASPTPPECSGDTADSGALGFDFNLPPQGTHTVWVRALVDERRKVPVDEAALDTEYRAALDDWDARLHRVALKLPAPAKELEDSFYAQIGWILVNKDGPAIQPGSRTYDRTWIRDGALTATALLYTGHAREVKEFLDWFRTFQYEDGKIPCCVDQRGPDPVPEHDSHGQYVYGVATYHRFTHDDDLLKRHWGNVRAAVGYIEKLRAARMTDEYRAGPDEERVKFGLMPESISHEGYSAKPMHSYWDDFFTLRGLTDAVYIAEAVGDHATAAEWAALRDDFRRTLVDSIALARKIRHITYIPGCAELGDFDATSTAAAVFPGGQAGGPLSTGLNATFTRYIDWFRDRRDGRLEWKDFTPYEMRNASALLMLGHPDQAHEVLDWMLDERASVGWREWAEIGYKDKKPGRFIGDMPHTWVGSDFVKAVRNLCVYERELDHALVVGAGLKPEWLARDAGVVVGNFPTEYGTISYTARSADGVIEFAIEKTDLRVPPGGIVVHPMSDRPVTVCTINAEPAKETGPGFAVVRTLPATVRFETAQAQ